MPLWDDVLGCKGTCEKEEEEVCTSMKDYVESMSINDGYGGER